MRSPKTCFVLLLLGFLAPGPLAYAQGTEPADKQKQPAPTGATKEEVEQLRREVAEQRQTIEALKAMVQRLVEVSQPGAGVARLVPASAVQPVNAAGSVELARADKQAPAKKAGETGLQTGWNGEHFFLKSADGNFLIQPYGYVQTDYRAFRGDAHPPNTFVLRRGRFGFQGKLGKHYEFSLLADFADTNSTLLRDFFMNVNYHPAFQFTFGQFKEPFGAEELTTITNIDNVERSLTSLLYPSPTSFRSPGAMIHGDLMGGVMQYFVGAFNGKGTLAANTRSEPEVVGRLKFYPWKKSKNELLQGFTFAGAVGHGRSRGLSNELSFNGTLPDGAFTFFPRFKINGQVQRYEGDLTWVSGPWGVRAEYVQLNQFRSGLSPVGVAGQNDLPGIVAKAYYAGATYLLTGEKRPENGAVRPKRPFLATEGGHGIGAWELKFRYSRIQAKTPNAPSPTGILRGANAHSDQFTSGLNWYLTYFVRYSLDFNVDRARDPTVGGAPPQTFLAVLQRLQFRF